MLIKQLTALAGSAMITVPDAKAPGMLRQAAGVRHDARWVSWTCRLNPEICAGLVPAPIREHTVTNVEAKASS